MKYVYLNDKSKQVGIHPSSSTKKFHLEPQETIVIEIPENTIPFIKTWDNDIVLLSYADEGAFK